MALAPPAMPSCANIFKGRHNLIAPQANSHDFSSITGGLMDTRPNNEVTVVDIKMPFLSMVIFMVKAAIAAIPAVIILSLVASVVMTLLAGFLGGPVRHF
jgi:hypothetical protein